MEEKKLNKAKMNVVGKDSQEKQKLSYEQLNDVCTQLYQQNQNLLKQLQQQNMVNMFKRLDYLFKVLEFSPVIKDSDFVNSCIEEIKDAIIIREDEKEESEEEK